MNTNYNNLYSDYIGATGIYSITDYIDITSNNLNNNINITSNILNSNINITSNILNSNIDITSNILNNNIDILQTQITATSNIIHTDNNSNVIIRLIAQNPNYPYYPLTETPIEMFFQTTEGDVKTKITQSGELMVYHPVAPLPAGYSPGWWGVENKIANVITDTQGLRFDVTNLQTATGAAAITNSSAASAAVAGAAAGAASGAATTAAAGAAIAQGDYGTVALGVAGGALFSVLGYLSYQAQIESNLTSNGFTTEAAQVHSNIVTVNGLVADNIGNIVTAKGFVHSNMLFAQNYINSNTVADLYLTKTGKINLNQVNNWIKTTYGTYYDITNGTLAINATPTQMDFLKVGGQTTIQGQLIVEGNIKENNTNLNAIYATINNVNISSNTLNTKIDTTNNNLKTTSNLLQLDINQLIIDTGDLYNIIIGKSNILNTKIDTTINSLNISSNTLNTKIDATINSLNISSNTLNTKIDTTNNNLATNYYTKINSDNRYLQLSGGSLIGDLIINKTNANIQIGSINGNNWAIPSNNGYFSLSASAGDMVLRSFNKLHLLSGGGFSAITINTSNNVGIGTNNPYTLLHVKGTNPALTIMAQGYTGATSQLNLSTYDTNIPNCSLIATDSGAYGASFQIKQKIVGADTNSQFTSFFIKENGNVGINTTNPICKLTVYGIANIHNGNPVAVRDNCMSGGSLTIGDTALSYGTATGWSTNTAGLMMECADNTEIAVHDSGNRLASLIYFEGGGTNTITIGRDKGWGAISLVDIKSGLNITGEFKNTYWKMTNQSDYCRLYNNAGTAYFNFAAAQLYADTTLQVNSTATINSSITASRYLCSGETVSFIANWNSTGTSGWFIILNNWWYLGHSYLNLALYLQGAGGTNQYCWFGRIFLSINGTGTFPATAGGVIQITTDYRYPTSGAYLISVNEKWDGSGNNALWIQVAGSLFGGNIKYKIYA